MMLIVVPPKRIDLLLRIVDRREPVHVQTLFAESAVERFDRRVVGGLAATTEVQDDPIGVRPQIHRAADELGAIVPSEHEVKADKRFSRMGLPQLRPEKGTSHDLNMARLLREAIGRKEAPRGRT